MEILIKKLGFVFVCPISSTKRKNPLYVKISARLAISGVIMSDQLRSLDYRSRGEELITTCAEELLVEVLGRIYPILF